MLDELCSRFSPAELWEYLALRGRERQIARVLRSEGVRYLWPMNALDRVLAPRGEPPPSDAVVDAAFEKFLQTERQSATKRSAKTSQKPARADILAYVNTRNQMAAIGGVLETLAERAEVQLHVKRAGVFDPSPFVAWPLDQSRAPMAERAFDFAQKAPLLMSRLARKGAPASPAAVLEIVQHLYMAFEILGAVQPRLLVLANDHTTPQRCLLAAAHLSGVRTAYVQHASVSPLFPRLDFDYALLDGVDAAETYAACRRNGALLSVVRRRPQVYLCGQQKPLRPADPDATVVGIAYNRIDDVAALNALAASLVRVARLRLRWHPRQVKADIARICELANSFEGRVELSDPAVEPVGQYLGGLRCLVAGDSSILVEAAIAGCATIYHRTMDAITDDYYGFVASGLARRAERNEDVERLVSDALSGHVRTPDARVVRRFSESFGTYWAGRERELAVTVIESQLHGRQPGAPFVRRSIPGAGRFRVMGLPA